jgi:hypothetical protein
LLRAGSGQGQPTSAASARRWKKRPSFAHLIPEQKSNHEGADDGHWIGHSQQSMRMIVAMFIVIH